LGEYEPAFSQLRHSIILDDSDDDRDDL
jgi:hypothetical protein